MRKKVGIIKRVTCIGLVFLLSINSFAAIVSDNDGSAFITKAEFDALKSSFQTQIDTYNQSIDSKIDGAIASYLSGIRLAAQVECVNVFKEISNGGHSGLDLTFGKDLGYMNVNGWIEGTQNYLSVGSQTSTSTLMTSLYGYTDVRKYLNSQYIYSVDASRTKINGMIQPEFAWFGGNSLSGTGGMWSSWVQDNPTSPYTWVDVSSYVNPFNDDINIEENGFYASGKAMQISATSWGFCQAWWANIGSLRPKDVWDHTIDFIVNNSKNDYVQKDPSSGSRYLKGNLYMLKDKPADSDYGQTYQRNSSSLVYTFNASAIYQPPNRKIFGLWNRGGTSPAQWYAQTWTGTDYGKAYKGIGIKLSTSSTNTTTCNMNDLEWPNLTAISATCKSPNMVYLFIRCLGTVNVY